MINEKEIDKWFYNLDDNIKEEIIDVTFSNDIIYNSDDEWRRLDFKTKLEIYRENNP